MKIVSSITVVVLILGLVGCSSSEQEKAKEQAREDLHKTAGEMKKAGSEIKDDAKQLTQRVDSAIQPDGESAESKLSGAASKAKEAAAGAGVKIDHAEMLARVKGVLVSDAGLSTLANVNVAVNAGVVTLSGTVSSDDQRRAAEVAASKVDGVTRVQNNLTVQP